MNTTNPTNTGQQVGSKDLSRNEAIEWCRDHVTSFKDPVFPPPSGWMWAEAGKDGQHTLEPIFILSNQRRITHADAFDFE